MSKAAKESHSAELMKQGFAERSPAELTKLLAHIDQRIPHGSPVRARRSESVSGPAAGRACFTRSTRPPARDLGHRSTGPQNQFGRSQAFRVCCTTVTVKCKARPPKSSAKPGSPPAAPALIELLKNPNARVQYFAAVALGKLQEPTAFAGLFELLKQNNNADPMLRHAAILALTRIGNTDALIAAANHDSAAVRLGAVVALRRAAT